MVRDHYVYTFLNRLLEPLVKHRPVYLSGTCRHGRPSSHDPPVTCVGLPAGESRRTPFCISLPGGRCFGYLDLTLYEKLRKDQSVFYSL